MRKRRPAPPAAPKPAARVAILVVNGFLRTGPTAAYNEQEAREFPWIKVCLEQIAKHTRRGTYDVHVWDNSLMPEHLEIMASHKRVKVYNRKRQRIMRHGPALDALVRRLPERTEYVVTLDSDSFPVRSGWLPNLLDRLDDGAMIAGAWRDEMSEQIPPYVHPSCLAIRRDVLADLGRFRVDAGRDVAHNLTVAAQERGGKISRLRRSNVRNGHFLMGGLYGDLVYHQGAGSRVPHFWASSDRARDEAIRVLFRDAVFSDLPALVEYLAGNTTRDEAAAAGLGPLVDLVEDRVLPESLLREATSQA